MSANSAVQHMASGLGAYMGGEILTETADGVLHNFPVIGLISVAATLLSLWFAGLVRPACEQTWENIDGELTAEADEVLEAKTSPAGNEFDSGRRALWRTSRSAHAESADLLRQLASSDRARGRQRSVTLERLSASNGLTIPGSHMRGPDYDDSWHIAAAVALQAASFC